MGGDKFTLRRPKFGFDTGTNKIFFLNYEIFDNKMIRIDQILGFVPKYLLQNSIKTFLNFLSWEFLRSAKKPQLCRHTKLCISKATFFARFCSFLCIFRSYFCPTLQYFFCSKINPSYIIRELITWVQHTWIWLIQAIHITYLLRIGSSSDFTSIKESYTTSFINAKKNVKFCFYTY